MASQNGHLEEALPLQLLALDLLMALLGTDGSDTSTAPSHDTTITTPALPTAASGDGEGLVRQAAAKLAATAQATAAALAARGWEGPLPDVVGVVYRCALHMGRGGAVEELLGNLSGAQHAYAKVLCKVCCLVRRVYLEMFVVAFFAAHDVWAYFSQYTVSKTAHSFFFLQVINATASCCLFKCAKNHCKTNQYHSSPQAGTLLYFLCTDLALFPAGEGLRLDDKQQAVLHGLVLHTSARLAACRQAGDSQGNQALAMQ